MKNCRRAVVALLCAVVAVLAVRAADPEPFGLKFESTSYDFGTVRDNVRTVEHDYEFVNTSSEPVAIVSASASCGCTRPSFPAKPVAPGEKASVKVTFLPAGQSGEINKEVKVRVRSASSKSSKRIVLRLSGVVVPVK